MQLAALALEDYSDKAERTVFIEAFAGSNRLIMDYLISEVLLSQTEAERQFLLRSSILDHFCAELCDQVVFDGPPGNSHPILENLEQANMFLIPLDDHHHWYRYHHLFKEILFHSLRRTSPDLILFLHKKACQWFAENGFTLEAVKHAIASEDLDRVNDLLDRYVLPIIFPGLGGLVIDWCRQIPRS